VTGLSPGRVTPFGNPRITGCLLLPVAFRSLPRPSSPDSSEASTMNSFSLDHILLLPLMTDCRRPRGVGADHHRYSSQRSLDVSCVVFSDVFAARHSAHSRKRFGPHVTTWSFLSFLPPLGGRCLADRNRTPSLSSPSLFVSKNFSRPSTFNQGHHFRCLYSERRQGTSSFPTTSIGSHQLSVSRRWARLDSN
jgi:hypothetical protein